MIDNFDIKGKKCSYREDPVDDCESLCESKEMEAEEDDGEHPGSDRSEDHKAVALEIVAVAAYYSPV